VHVARDLYLAADAKVICGSNGGRATKHVAYENLEGRCVPRIAICVKVGEIVNNCTVENLNTSLGYSKRRRIDTTGGAKVVEGSSVWSTSHNTFIFPVTGERHSEGGKVPRLKTTILDSIGLSGHACWGA
jgi:hypothetical protein